MCPSVPLCRPDPLDSFCDTNVIRLELVQSHANSQGSSVETPPKELPRSGVSLLGDVVDDDGLETHVGVKQDGSAEDSIGGGVQGAGGERRDGERDEAGGEETLEGPVVGTMGGVGFGNGSGIIDASVDFFYHVRKRSEISMCSQLIGREGTGLQRTREGRRLRENVRGPGGRRARWAVVWKAAVLRRGLPAVRLMKALFARLREAIADCLSTEGRAKEAMMEDD